MRMRTFLIAACAVFLAVAPAWAGGSRERGAEQSANLSGFTRIDAQSGVTVDIHQGKTFEVKASGDRDALDRLEMTVRGDVLRIGFKRLAWGMGSVHVDVTLPRLEQIRLSGGSRGIIDFDATSSPRVKLTLSGGSRLEGVFLASDLSADVSGGSRLAIEGYAQAITASASGGSRIDSLDFAVGTATLELSGGSIGALAVQNQLTVEASGGSRLEYRGNPKVVQDLSGAASVDRSSRAGK